MKKMFRFKYEPCAGSCYAYCDVLIKALRAMGDTARRALVQLMTKAHDKLCDNPEFSFGVDVDEASGLFVAHFRRPDRTDLYAQASFADCVGEVCHAVLATEIPRVAGACQFGDNGAENLGREIIAACTDEGWAKLQADHSCVCKAGNTHVDKDDIPAVHLNHDPNDGVF